jgi:hypothetical protein
MRQADEGQPASWLGPRYRSSYEMSTWIAGRYFAPSQLKHNGDMLADIEIAQDESGRHCSDMEVWRREGATNQQGTDSVSTLLSIQRVSLGNVSHGTRYGYRARHRIGQDAR